MLGGVGYTAPSDQLNVAGIGAGRMGGGDIATVSKLGANIVALCDVDQFRAAGSFTRLEWDSENQKVTNAPELNPFVHTEYRKGWTL